MINSLKLYLNNNWIGLVVLTICTTAFATLIYFVSRKTGSDDVYFAHLTQAYPSVTDYLAYRYDAWSARLLPEIFIYYLSAAPLMYWKMISVVSFFATGLLLLAYYRMIQTALKFRINTQGEIIITLCIGLLQIFTGLAVFSDSVLWVTGAMNYAWLLPLILVGAYPVVRFLLTHTWPHPVISLIGIVVAAITAASSEQGAVLLIGVSGLALVSLVVRHHRSIKRHIADIIKIVVFAAASLSGFAYLMLAPGNAVRTAREYSTRMPGVDEVPFIDRAGEGVRWLVEALVNQSGIIWMGLIALLLIIVLGVIVKRRRDVIVKYSIVTILSGALALLVLRGQDSIRAYLYNFSIGWTREPEHFYVYIIVIWWVIVIVTTLLAPIFATRGKNKSRGYLVSLAILMGYGSMAVMCFSPTMYASGWRPLLIPLMVLGLVSIGLLALILHKQKHSFILYATVVALVTAGIGYFVSYFVHVLFVA